MPGSELCQMQREYFTSVCPQYGHLIYDSLQSLLGQFRSVGYLAYPGSQSQQHAHHQSHQHGPHATSNVCSVLNEPLHVESASTSSSVAPHNLPSESSMSHTHELFPQISSLEVMSSNLFDAQVSQLNYSPSYTSGKHCLWREILASMVTTKAEHCHKSTILMSHVCSVRVGPGEHQ